MSDAKPYTPEEYDRIIGDVGCKTESGQRLRATVEALAAERAAHEATRATLDASRMLCDVANERAAKLLTERDAARADAARLRDVVRDVLGRPMVEAEGTNPAVVTIHIAVERVEKWRAALAATDSTWLREHDLRIAERVYTAAVKWATDCDDAHDEGSAMPAPLDLAALLSEEGR
jgi:hypothetical protein